MQKQNISKMDEATEKHPEDSQREESRERGSERNRDRPEFLRINDIFEAMKSLRQIMHIYGEIWKD